MLIRNATLADGTRTDVRITAARITALAPHLPAQGETQIIEAGGGALLPGLHDHHIHLFALAASLESLPCGPPHTAASLRAQLRAAPGTGPAGPGRDSRRAGRGQRG